MRAMNLACSATTLIFMDAKQNNGKTSKYAVSFEDATLEGFINKTKKGIHAIITEYVRKPSALVSNAAAAERYSEMLFDYINRPSHYTRPMLLMLTALMYDNQDPATLLLAAAVQLSQEWILIHDDIEDKSEMRRGMPTLHKLYGSSIALHIGDVLHSVMWNMFIDYLDAANPAIRERLYNKFIEVAYSTAGGQFQELNFMYGKDGLRSAKESTYLEIAGGKTSSYSMRGPLQLGAISAAQDENIVEKLGAIGENAGIAFQINDDIIDMQKGYNSGKGEFNDIREGKLTLIVKHTFDLASDDEKQRLVEIYNKPREQKTGEEIKFVIDAIEKYDGIGFAVKKRDEIIERTTEQMLGFLDFIPKNKFAAWLQATIINIYNREQLY